MNDKNELLSNAVEDHIKYAIANDMVPELIGKIKAIVGHSASNTPHLMEAYLKIFSIPNA